MAIGIAIPSVIQGDIHVRCDWLHGRRLDRPAACKVWVIERLSFDLSQAQQMQIAPPGQAPRKRNPFLAGLARAMHSRMALCLFRLRTWSRVQTHGNQSPTQIKLAPVTQATNHCVLACLSLSLSQLGQALVGRKPITPVKLTCCTDLHTGKIIDVATCKDNIPECWHPL
jgi:hypothetical protein